MRTSIYLPDDLAAKVKEHKLSISAIAQRALHAEIDRIEAQTVTDYEAVQQIIQQQGFPTTDREYTEALLVAFKSGRIAQSNSAMTDLDIKKVLAAYSAFVEGRYPPSTTTTT